MTPPVSPPRIVVVGSVNMDLVAAVDRLPRPGETVPGRDFQTIPGGKGANQAVAAARLGAATAMIARVGDDPFGATLRAGLAGYGVDTRHVAVTPGVASGVALIGVEAGGQNDVIVVPGANGRLTPGDVAALESVIASAQALVCQLEVPLETVRQAVALARRHGVLTVLDPAPAPRHPLPDDLLAVDVISPNQSEAEVLCGVAVPGPREAVRASAALHARGARRVVLKLGNQGALLCDPGGDAMHVPPFPCQAVDATAAGDAFTAALACGLASGWDARETVRFACAAGGLATTRFGAQPAMPARAEVDALVRAHPGP